MQEYNCELCNTKYKTDKSLAIHNKKFHQNNQIKKYICKYCNKEYETRQSKSVHQIKYCKYKENLLNKQKEAEEEIKINLEEIKINLEERKINLEEKKIRLELLKKKLTDKN